MIDLFISSERSNSKNKNNMNMVNLSNKLSTLKSPREKETASREIRSHVKVFIGRIKVSGSELLKYFMFRVIKSLFLGDLGSLQRSPEKLFKRLHLTNADSLAHNSR